MQFNVSITVVRPECTWCARVSSHCFKSEKEIDSSSLSFSTGKITSLILSESSVWSIFAEGLEKVASVI